MTGPLKDVPGPFVLHAGSLGGALTSRAFCLHFEGGKSFGKATERPEENEGTGEK